MGSSAQAASTPMSRLLACVFGSARGHPGVPTPLPQAALDGARARGQRWTLPAATRAGLAAVDQRVQKPCQEGATTMEQIGDTVYVPVKALAPNALLHQRPLPWVLLNTPRVVPQAC